MANAPKDQRLQPKKTGDAKNKTKPKTVTTTSSEDDAKLFKTQFQHMKPLFKDNVNAMEEAIKAAFKTHKTCVYHTLGFKGSRSETTFINTPMGTMAIMELAYLKLNQQ